MNMDYHYDNTEQLEMNFSDALQELESNLGFLTLDQLRMLRNSLEREITKRLEKLDGNLSNL